MDLFRRKTPEEKAAEQAAREAQRKAEEAAREAQRKAEEERKAIEVERARRVKAAQAAIKDFYLRQAPKWEYFLLAIGGGKDSREYSFKYQGALRPLDQLEDVIDEMGRNGWELTGIASFESSQGTATWTSDQILYFKRPLPPLTAELAQQLKDAESYGGELS